MKRRTNEDNIKNNLILQKLFEKHTDNNKTANVTYWDLREEGYIGSYPYPFPTFYKDFAIRKIPYEKDCYSILNLHGVYSKK